MKTGQLRTHCREDRITRVLSWAYDPAATCPRWERFLTEILPDAETVEFVRRAIGYSLTGDTSEHVLFSCFGAGANGKSTLLNVLLHLFGPYGTTAPTSMLVAKQHESHPAEKVVLVAKRLVEFQEIPSGQRLNEALVKALVSGDPDQARAMRENFFEFRPVGKLWLAGNHRLDIREQTDAIWRRYREIPFEKVFQEGERDHGLEETLRGEVAGILAWGVRACLEWQRLGLGKSGKVLAATAIFELRRIVEGRFWASAARSHPPRRLHGRPSIANTARGLKHRASGIRWASASLPSYCEAAVLVRAGPAQTANGVAVGKGSKSPPATPATHTRKILHFPPDFFLTRGYREKRAGCVATCCRRP